MKSFSLKSIAFYGLSIGFVVTLFSVVTAYGESKLKASAPISGDYVLRLPTASGCLTENPVNLSIQQSGIYVSAALLRGQSSVSSDKLSAKAMTLHGQWKDQQLQLQGVIPSTAICMTSNKAARDSWVDTKIQGTFRQSTLDGKLWLNTADSLPFAAQKQVQPKTEGSSH